MKLYLVRHGQTASNREGVGLGREDVALTEFGQRQAARLAVRMAGVPLDRVVTSPLLRARQTATEFASKLSLEVEADDALLELDVGATEGMPFPEMREKYPDFLRLWASPECAHVRMPGGESLQDLSDRLDPFVEHLHEAQAESLAVVSHNFTTKILLCRLLDLPLAAFRHFATDLASVSVLDVRGGRTEVLLLNDTCHLQDLVP